VIETLYIGEEPTAHGPMLSTNVFQRGASGWCLLSHHSSAASDAVEATSAQDARRTLH